MNHIIQSIGTRFAVVLTFLALALPFTACEDFDEPQVSVSAEEILIGSAAANVPVTIYSNTSWTARSDAAWCVLSLASGKGTTEIELLVEANKSDKSRTANIAVSMADGRKTDIRVTQNRLSDTEVRVTPQLITLPAAAAQGIGFSVATQYKDAKIETGVLSGGQWISNLSQTETVSGYSKTAFYRFDVTKNTGAEERKGLIGITVTFGRKTYEYVVEVIQNGLGAPAVSTAATAYMMPVQTVHTQDLWVESGDRDNVRYEVSVVSNQSGIDGDLAWLKSATVETSGRTHTLRITAAANDTDEVREGDVLIVAYRDNATTKVGVHVVQSAYMSAGVQVPATLLTHTHLTGEYPLPVNALNRSVVSVVASSAPWLRDARVSENSLLRYTLDAYDGSTGEYREAVLTLKAANGNADEAFVYLTVRQYAPDAAGIATLPQMLTYANNAEGGMFFIEAQNGSEVTVASVTEWIGDVELYDGAVTYSLAPYDGAEGDFRDGTITLWAENDHANRQVYTVVIRQYAPPAAAVQLPQSVVTYTHEASDRVLPLNPMNGAVVSVVNVNAAWVRNVQIGQDNASVSYSLDAFDGASGDSREAVITLRATNAHANTSIHYLHIRQYAPQPAGVSSLPEMLSFGSFAQNRIQFMVGAQNGSKIQAGSTKEWIRNAIFERGIVTFDLDAYDGSAGDFREGLITLLVGNDHANVQVYNVVVRQYAPAAAGVDLPSSMLTYTYFGDTYTIPINPVNGSEVTVQGCNAGWVTDFGLTSAKDAIYYTLEEYDGNEGAYRDAVLTIKATNSNFNAIYYYLFIRQYAPDPAGITSVPQMLTFSSKAQAQQFMVGAQNGSMVIPATTTSWIKHPLCEDGISVTFELEAYNGAEGDFREGVITLIAANDHIDPQVYNVVIRQYAPQAPSLDLPASTVTYTSSGSGEDEYGNPRSFTMPLNPKNASEVTVIGNNSGGWVDHVAVAADRRSVSYSVAEYNGREGDFREAVLTFKAANTYKDAAVYYLTIRQYAPAPAGITSVPQLVTYNSGATDGMFPVGAQNSSLVHPTTDAGWITTLRNDNGMIRYTLSAYDGSAGDFRDAVIRLKATNTHANAQVYSVVVRQYAPKAAGADVPAAILTYPYGAANYTLPVNPLNGSHIEIVGNSAPAWVTPSYDAVTGLAYTFTEYNGSAGDYRDAVLTLKASNTNSNAAFYYVTLRQFAPAPAGITSAPQMLTFSSQAQRQSFLVAAQNGSEIEADSNLPWVTATANTAGLVTMNFEAYNGAEGAYRESTIAIRARNDHANVQVYNVVVRQYAPAEAGIELPGGVVTYMAAAGDYTLPVNVLNNSTVSIQSAPAWMTGSTLNENGNGLFTFHLAAYDGAYGAYREGTVAIRASNTNSNARMVYLTVRQNAPVEAGIHSVPALLTYASGATAGEFYVAAKNGTDVVPTSGAAWITAPNYQNGRITFTMSAYDGSQGDFREGLLTLTAGNGMHIEKQVYTVVVRQYAPKAAAISDLPPYIGLGYQALANQTLPIQALNGSTVTVESAPAWLTATITDNSRLTYSVSEYTAATGVSMGYFREGTLVLKAARTGNADAAYYYVTVRQYARTMAFLRVTQGTFADEFLWTQVCGGNNVYSGTNTGDFKEARIQLNNVSPTGTVSWGTTGGTARMDFVTVGAANEYTWKTVFYQDNTVNEYRGSTTLNINVNSYPYVQTLTQTARWHQAVWHNHA